MMAGQSTEASTPACLALPALPIAAASDGGWQGDYLPASSIRVMDDETFLKGRYNVEEGGTKGLSLSGALNLLAITSEHQPLAFFDLATVLPRNEPSVAH